MKSIGSVLKVTLVITWILTSAALAAGNGQGAAGIDFVPGQLVIEGPPESLGGAFQVIKYLPRSNLTVVAVERGRELAQLRSVRARGRRAGINRMAHTFATVDDSFYTPYQWHLSHVQSELAWDLTNGGGAVVAVLDTGVNTAGTDGFGCLLPGYDFVNEDPDPTDLHRHGTHVAGTLAQASNNTTGTAGLAYGACVMPVKVLDDSGSGTFADIAEGVFFAVDNGASVINMSLGTNSTAGVTNDPILDPALDYAYANGVTVVCAAGNDGNRDNVSYPAIYSTTLAVGATDYVNSVTPYSNGGQGLDLVAPGGDTSVDLNGDGFNDGVVQETFFNTTWGYFFFQGTSMATPHVAAAAALLYAYGTATHPDDVRAALTSTAADLAASGWDADTGHGLLQAYGALLWNSGSCVDADSDGWCVIDNDCNDNDPLVHPAAPEVCGDGIDNNCDGAVDEGCPTNNPPTAAASSSCNGLSCAFADESFDVDGFIVAWTWTFGDGTTSSEQHPSHSYPQAGSYSCNLTVTDDQGATDSATDVVTVSEPGPAITLTADGYVDRNRNRVDLTWAGAQGSKVDVWRNSELIGTTRNDGSHTDTLSRNASGAFVYQICERGTSTCSNLASVSF